MVVVAVRAMPIGSFPVFDERSLPLPKKKVKASTTTERAEAKAIWIATFVLRFAFRCLSVCSRSNILLFMLVGQCLSYSVD